MSPNLKYWISDGTAGGWGEGGGGRVGRGGVKVDIEKIS